MNEHSPSDKPRRRKSALATNEAKYLSESAFARHTGMGRTTVWRLRKSGRLRYVRISPRLIRIPISEITRLGRQPVATPANKDPAE
jgi:predicted DNA-binding transcriptional regulator AlpA